MRAQRSAEVRAQWAAHVAAWRERGGRQYDDCRERGLDPRYFSIWKGRPLRLVTAEGNEPPKQPRPTLVPVVMTPMPPDQSVGRPEAARDVEFGLGVTLPNGIALTFRLPSVRAQPPLLAELSRLSC